MDTSIEKRLREEIAKSVDAHKNEVWQEYERNVIFESLRAYDHLKREETTRQSRRDTVATILARLCHDVVESGALASGSLDATIPRQAVALAQLEEIFPDLKV